MDQTRIFLEVPEQFYELPADGVTDWIQIFPKPGIYNHPGYGRLEITPAKLERMADSFKRRIYQEHIPVDAEHQTKLSGALGYYRDVEARDDGLYARIELTDRGKTLIGEDRFKYFSAELWPTWDDPAGGSYQDVLIGGAFTSRPFFKDTVQRPIAASELAAEESQEFMAAGQPRDDHGKWSKGGGSGGSGGSWDAHDAAWRSKPAADVGPVDSKVGKGLAPGTQLSLDNYTQLKVGQVLWAKDGSPFSRAEMKKVGRDAWNDWNVTQVTSKGVQIAQGSMTSVLDKYRGEEIKGFEVSHLGSHVLKASELAAGDESISIPQVGKQEQAMTEPNAQAFSELQERYGELESKHTELSQKYGELELRNKALADEATAAKKESESYSERITALESAARRKRFTDLVTGHGGAGDGQHWFGEPEQHVNMLMQLGQAFGEDSDVFKSYVTQQESTASAVAASVQHSEVGRSPRPTEGGNSAMQKFDAAVAERIAANPNLSRSQALAAVIADNPQLYAEYSRAQTKPSNGKE